MIKQLLSVGFLVALTANGWGGVLAAGACPHRDCVTSAAAERHPASHTEEAQPEEHCSKGKDGEHSERQSQQPAAGETTEPLTGQVIRAADEHARFCGHCMSAPQAPSRNSQKGTQSQARRVVNLDTPAAAGAEVLPGVASFPAITPSQCSPPAHAGRRKHLLISTFLI